MANTKMPVGELPIEPEYTDQTKFEAYTGNEPYLFVSYSHRDSKKVYRVLDALYDKKFRLWYDESCETGNDFREELRIRIKNSSGILLFVSEASMTSPFCGMEIITARELGKALYPIYVDNESVVPPAFSILLSNTQHRVITTLESRGMEKLVAALVRDLPPETMNRLTKDTEEPDRLVKCEDNGTSIEVDEGIRIISQGAFKGRRMLHYIKMPQTLERIEREAFRGCSNLQEMDIPVRTAQIGDSAFRDCVCMRTLTVRNDRIRIGERAFENCAGLEEVDLPDGLIELYGGVFNSCRSLQKIKLPRNLTILGESAFSDCTSLESMDIPETVTKIDDLVFNGCTNLREIVLHEGLRKIGKSAFKNCRELTQVEIPASVTSIGDAPFRGCVAMKSIHVSDKNKHYKSAPSKRDGKDHVLFNKNKSTLIAYPASSREVQYDIPDSVTVISDWAFCECSKLNRITIPDSVYEICEGAFCNCSLLDEVEIPDSVVKIDDCVFRGCTKLERVVIPSSVKELGWGLFDGCEDRVTVYCDVGSLAYEYCIRNGIREARISEREAD